MRGSRNVPARGLLVACSVALYLTGCGGKEFVSSQTAGAGGGAGTDGTAGNAQGGTETGGATTGGSAGAEGGAQMTGGAGGTSPVGCNCPAGNYCRDGSTDCFKCSELSRLRFRPPERLAALSDGLARYPRVGATGKDLLYQFGGVGLRYTTDSSTSAGSSVATTQPDDASPLLLSSDVEGLPAAGVESFNFVFDRVVEGVRREVHFGRWSNGLQSSQAPASYNPPGSTNFGLAVALAGGATDVARGYWMSDRVPGGGIVLMTALFALDSPEASVVDLKIGSPTCSPLPEDGMTPFGLTPWVTPDGKTLLFSHPRVDPACAATDQGRDLYTALMLPDVGQPTAPAAPLGDVNSPQDDVDPSFSADYCDLYFSSNRDGAFALYRAHRR